MRNNGGVTINGVLFPFIPLSTQLCTSQTPDLSGFRIEAEVSFCRRYK
jgi:hypothetical protein